MKKFDHQGYNKNLKKIARKLCNNSTPAEIRLWKELQLIIEVDGESHDDYQWVKDQARQKELEEAGFTVLRFTDEEIFQDIENVSRVLEHWVEGHPPAPLQRGRIKSSPFEGRFREMGERIFYRNTCLKLCSIQTKYNWVLKSKVPGGYSTH